MRFESERPRAADDFQPLYAVLFAALFELGQDADPIPFREHERAVVTIADAQFFAHLGHQFVSCHVELRFQRAVFRVVPRVHDAAVCLARARCHVLRAL